MDRAYRILPCAAQTDHRSSIGRRVALDRQLSRRCSRGSRIELHFQRYRQAWIQGHWERGARHRVARTRKCSRVDGHRRRPRGVQRQRQRRRRVHRHIAERQTGWADR
jgi:hypothetical protein